MFKSLKAGETFEWCGKVCIKIILVCSDEVRKRFEMGVVLETGHLYEEINACTKVEILNVEAQIVE